MTRSLLVCVFILACSSIVASAQPPDELKAVVQKLFDGGNYSWCTDYGLGEVTAPAPAPDFQLAPAGWENRNSGQVQGKLQQDGLVLVRVSYPNGTGFQSGWSIDCFVKGGKMAVHTLIRGWMSDAQILAHDAGGGLPADSAIYETQAVVPPAVEARNYVDQMTDIRRDGDAYVGILPPDVALQMMVHRMPVIGGWQPINRAGATVRFWIKRGVLSKYEVRWSMDSDACVYGVNSVFHAMGLPAGSVTAVTQIIDVGSTVIDLPAEAKDVLDSKAASMPAPQRRGLSFLWAS
jgi:hypothetical protein